MIQKEVATRILAQPNSKNYGLLTLFCQYHFDIKKGFNVSKNCFFPQPNVDSYVIKLIPTKNHFPLKDEPLFFAMTKSLFWGRRKTIYKCLTTSPYINCPKSIKNNPNIKSKLSLRGESQSISDLYLLFDHLKHEMKLKKYSKTKPDFDIN